MTNAAKFAGVEEIDVYVEVTEAEIAVFVRDRGAGFDPALSRTDRQGHRRVDPGPARARRRLGDCHELARAAAPRSS